MPAIKKAKLVILISGSGSNLQAFIDQCQSGQLNAGIACVISNKPEAYGLERARNANIRTQCLDHRHFESRETFDQALADMITPFKPDLIILAGFMRILTPTFVKTFCRKLINIHPSLLPKYPGLDTHQRAIDAKEDKAGATVHFVTEELDGGPPILQAQVEIQSKDTAKTLADKILPFEHLIYPLATKWILEGKIDLDEGKAYFNNQPIKETGILFSKNIDINASDSF